MLKYGLIGHKIRYSKSPQLHLSAAKLCGLDISYDLLDIEPQFFEKAYVDLLASDYSGFNVTQPYKQKIAKKFSNDLLSVNTLYKEKNVWRACSTDGKGLLYACKIKNISLAKHSTLCILGNGGVVPSVVDAFKIKHPHIDIHIVRRDESKDLLFHKYPQIMFHDFNVQTLKDIILHDKKTIVLQATSAPLFGDNLRLFREAFDKFQGLFIEMLYGDHKSAIYDHCIERNIKTVDGLDVLKGQAYLAQKFWWNTYSG